MTPESYEAQRDALEALDESDAWMLQEMGISLQPVIFVLVFLVSLVVPLFVWAVEPLWNGTQVLAVGLLGTVLVFGLCGSFVIALRRHRGAQSKRAASALTNTANEEDQLISSGTIVTASEPALPAVLAELRVWGTGSHQLLVTSQPFVVETGSGPLLIDTPFLVVLGFDRTWKWNGRDALAHLSLEVGNSVVARGTMRDQAEVPVWFRQRASELGYRDRSIPRLLGSEETPIYLARAANGVALSR